jgi:aromatic aminotransferase
MITSGANQAFVNVLLTLTDVSDTVALFQPYYFNHLMACQMTGSARTVMFGPPDACLKPDLVWLEGVLAGDTPPKMVVIVNPCNPAGVFVPQVADASSIAW